MTNKKDYTVHGSHDGVIGVYSNIKKAYEKAIDYIENEEAVTTLVIDNPDGTYYFSDVKGTYSNICKFLDKNSTAELKSKSDGRDVATITMYYLNV